MFHSVQKMNELILKTGFGEEREYDDTTLKTLAALLRIFSKESIRVSAKYTLSKGRKIVTENDMKLALMYCAQTFLTQPDAILFKKVQDEIEVIDNESDEEEGEEEEEEEGEEEEDEEGEGEEEEGEEGEESDNLQEADLELVRRMEHVAETWCEWNPEDEVYKLLKRAIDNT